jgi:hypothetical protein
MFFNRMISLGGRGSCQRRLFIWSPPYNLGGNPAQDRIGGIVPFGHDSPSCDNATFVNVRASKNNTICSDPHIVFDDNFQGGLGLALHGHIAHFEAVVRAANYNVWTQQAVIAYPDSLLASRGNHYIPITTKVCADRHLAVNHETPTDAVIAAGSYPPAPQHTLFDSVRQIIDGEIEYDLLPHLPCSTPNERQDIADPLPASFRLH